MGTGGQKDDDDGDADDFLLALLLSDCEYV